MWHANALLPPPPCYQARLEFQAHGLGDVITVTHADACGLPGFDLDGVADAVTSALTPLQTYHFLFPMYHL